jgi:hypothetical protein
MLDTNGAVLLARLADDQPGPCQDDCCKPQQLTVDDAPIMSEPGWRSIS